MPEWKKRIISAALAGCTVLAGCGTETAPEISEEPASETVFSVETSTSPAQTSTTPPKTSITPAETGAAAAESEQPSAEAEEPEDSLSGQRRLFHQGLLAVSTGGRWGYIDTSGRFVIEPRFDRAENPVDHGITWIDERPGKFGYFGSWTETVSEACYDGTLSLFYDDGYAGVMVGSVYGIIDSKGNFIADPQFDAVHQ